jgi:dynein heavy chain 1
MCDLVQILNLGYYSLQNNPFEITHNYVQNCFVPIFNSYRNAAVKNCSDQQSLEQLYKKMNELNRILIQCQNSIDVPEINLQIDPVVKQVCDRAKMERRQAKLDDLGDKLHRPDFIV